MRIHWNDYEPMYFGRSPNARFNAPDEQYGVLYVASDMHGAFIETLGHNTGLREVAIHDLAVRGPARVSTQRPLRLVNLTGPRLAQLGADARLWTGDYRIAQRWALMFWRHRDQPDGLWYPSRHDPERFCAAIFDRAATSINAERLGSLIDPIHTATLANVLDTYRFALH
ncbi:MAG: RES family NAD+ phosphorylase [Chloroflexota bacterium]